MGRPHAVSSCHRATRPATLESTRAWLQRVVSIRDGVAIDTATRAAYEAERVTRAVSARASFAACQIDDDVLDDPRRHFEIVRARDKVSRWLETGMMVGIIYHPTLGTSRSRVLQAWCPE